GPGEPDRGPAADAERRRDDEHLAARRSGLDLHRGDGVRHRLRTRTAPFAADRTPRGGRLRGRTGRRAEPGRHRASRRRRHRRDGVRRRHARRRHPPLLHRPAAGGSAMTFSRLLVVAALLGGASLARAQVLERTALPAFRAPTWALAAGVRTAYIKGAGFDPFSSNDAIVGFSLSGTRVLVRDGDLSLAAGVGLDLGTSSASARGVPARLSLTQVSALAEGRYQPWSRFYLFGRLAPGLMHGA